MNFTHHKIITGLVVSRKAPMTTILPLEKQVCGLESAKRLKELGFSQDSLFMWFKALHNPDEWYVGISEDVNYVCEPFHYSAYTVAELGEFLPDWFYSQRLDGKRGWVCDGDNEMSPNPYIEDCDTEAEARAKMLIYLAEHKLLTEKE